MLEIKCPNCNKVVEISPEFLGKQVGCVGCHRVYFLSEQYNDFRYKRLVIFNAVVFCLVVLGILFKVEYDYKFVGRSAKAANKAVGRKMDKLFGEKESSGGLDFFDFDKAYGTVADKLSRRQPVILPAHKGRIVEWGGEVLEVYAVVDNPYGDYCIKFRQMQGASSDVTVYFLADQAESLGDVEKGHYLKYQGIIVSAAYGNTDHILKRGKILNSN